MSSAMSEGIRRKHRTNVPVVKLTPGSIHQKSAHNIEPSKRRKLQHDASQWQAQSHHQGNGDVSHGQQPSGALVDTTLTLSNPQHSTGLHTSAHGLSTDQQAGRFDGDLQGPLNDDMLLTGLHDDAAFRYTNDHDHSKTGPSGYPSEAGGLVRGEQTAPLTTSANTHEGMSVTAPVDPNNHPDGHQFHEPETGFPQLNPTSLEMDNIFDNVDFLVGHLDFSTPNPPLQHNQASEHEVAPAPPVLSGEQNTRALSGPSTHDTHRIAVDCDENQEINVFSRIGSPLPSLRLLPGARSQGREGRGTLDTGSGPCWKVSQADYIKLQAKMAKYSEVFPTDLVLPSRHTMSAYLERCINSLYKHQPLFHVPTFRVADSALELILAMCATGAQLRFESHTGVPLFHASKALIMSRLQHRHEESLVSTLKQQCLANAEMTAAGSLQSPNSERQSPTNGLSDTSPNQIGNYSQLTSISTASRQRLQTIQAILTLMSFGSWGLKGLLGETILLQSLLVMLAREEGLTQEAESIIELSGSAVERWHAWIETESWRRVKIITYTFTNLQSLAYNMAPPLPSAEVRCLTPASADEWAAANAQRWEEVRRASRITAVPFQDAFHKLFQQEVGDAVGNADDSPSISALGNYALIFGLLQCIYFLRQRHPVPCSNGADIAAGSNLRGEDIDSIIRALHRWQRMWEKCPESTIEPEASAGPISFNAIACLRLAWIRLYADLGPCRALATRDPSLIVRVFTSGPSLPRHPQLTPVLLQAIHALSVPVRLGIKFVARSQSLFWSVNQSLCALECAVILSKWFETLASTLAQTPMSKQEKNLVLILRGMVLESGFFTEGDLDTLSLSAEARQGTNANNTNPDGTDRALNGNLNAATHASTGSSTTTTTTTTTSTNAGANEDLVSDARIFGMDLDHWILQEMAMPTPPSPKDDATAWQRQISGLRVAVARLWAEVFSDNHVFDVVTTIGRTLNVHAKMLEGII
ncbi:putative C2H2 transcription factor (AmdA) [Cladophialophora carrionii]|uniref:Putative C2H2 transcription factor (AmdA) n=1 Tax=Cladophialophora carrionii TaxID=86049 RepID=A0A1C1CR73_9EURO|nr:putative C2H2 transcription factor (AmdA) [Cladophialophora carrionii]